MNQVIIEEAKLQHNINIIKERVSNVIDDKGNPPKIIAVLKGNAYGMGVENVARKLLDNNINFFAVTEIAEAVELREKGFENEILVLNSTCIESEIDVIVKNDFIATVGSIEAIKILNRIAKQNNKIINCHLKIDTGFSRFGFRAEDFINSKKVLDNLKELIIKSENIKITGTYSHFQESYSNDMVSTKKQFELFMNVIENFKKMNIEYGMLHICNSSAFFKYKEMYLNAVRIGSAFSGRLQISDTTGLQKVGFLESEICEIKDLKKGDKVGYSGTCKLKKDSKVAVVEAGYFDGIGLSGPKDSARLIDKLRMIKSALLALTKDGHRYIYINEKRYPILGRIGMKNFMIDISESDIQIGNKVKIDINLILANQSIERKLR